MRLLFFTIHSSIFASRSFQTNTLITGRSLHLKNAGFFYSIKIPMFVPSMKSIVMLIMIFCSVMGKSLCADAHALNFGSKVEYTQSDHDVGTAKVQNYDVIVPIPSNSEAVLHCIIVVKQEKNVNFLSQSKPHRFRQESSGAVDRPNLCLPINKLSSEKPKRLWITNCRIKQCLYSTGSICLSKELWLTNCTIKQC